MLNKIHLIGHIGNAPEIKSTSDGKKFAVLSIATSESWKDKDSGEKKTKTEWHRVVVFSEPLVSIISQYVKKGSKLFIEGQMTYRKWTDDSGAEKQMAEVVIKQRGKIVLLDKMERSDNPPDTAYEGSEY